ncbi:MAG: anaerobic ribonucleoside-triphosphate reductase [Bacteroidales bacterium]|nr:anaerobic ribonucleoside-triphosphate reductase [Bacteroidales bacterium]
MDVRKTNGTYEEYDRIKLMNGIRLAYVTTGQPCPEDVVVSIVDNMYIYDKISSQEIRRQVVESLMSINKKVALEYIETYDRGMDLRKKSDFIRDYIKASNAATGSKFDSNANVTSKNIVTLGHELYKENNIKQNRYIMQDKIRALYGRGMAQQYIDDLESHVLYKHDESGTPGYPYCVAITMYPFLISGLKELGGVSVAPTDLKSFCGEFINLVYSISSQFMGAVATPEFLMYLDYFIRKDYGDDYLDRLDDVVENNVKQRTLKKVIDNCFQQVVHSMNMPAGNRGYQTVFWNVGYFDKPYFDGVFGDFRFPDGTAPKWETLSWLQKHFMNWFNEERNHYILTFPVETMALLTDGGDDYADKEYADFTAEMWAKGHSFFCYISNSPDSLSSCCRLRNSLKDCDDGLNHTTHQYSMGTASVATGSKSVMTINLNRLIQDAARKYFKQEEGVILPQSEALTRKSYDKDTMYAYIKETVTDQTVRVHKYQTAFNEIIKDFLKADMLDVYRAGFIDMRKQYLTVGVNGLTDAAEFLGLEVSPNDDYREFVNMLLETINAANRADRTPDCMFNTEFVPGENLSGKNYKWDKKDGYFVSRKHNMYSSYFYNPEDESLSMIDKFKLHGEEYVKYLDGGSALHVNISEHLSKDQYRQLLNTAAHYGTNYFTFNCRNTVCNDCGYISKDTLDVCPKCGSHNLDYLTRIIGYLKRVSSFSEMRQEEARHRYYLGK